MTDSWLRNFIVLSRHTVSGSQTRTQLVQRKPNLMHNLFLTYFLNLFMFRAYLDPSSRGITVWIQQLVLIILFRWLSVVLVGLDSNPTRTTDQHLKRIINTNCIHTVVHPDDGPRYARNMNRLRKYTKNKLCIKLVFLYTIISRCTVKQTYNLNTTVTSHITSNTFWTIITAFDTELQKKIIR